MVGAGSRWLNRQGRAARRRWAGWLRLVLLAGLVAAGLPVAAGQVNGPDSRVFAETGYAIRGPFRAYWESRGGLEQFGFPLTREFLQFSPSDPGRKYITQYFERAIFEYHPENAGTRFEVLLRLAGNLTTVSKGRTFPAANPTSVAIGGRVLFPQTRHSLGGRFLAYWQASGGLPVYGFPISEEFRELNPADNKTYTVQYFERARFEYHPENTGTRYEILQGLLGWQELQLCEVPASNEFIGQPYRTLGPALPDPDFGKLPAVLPPAPPAPELNPIPAPVPSPTPVPALPPRDPAGPVTPLTISPLKVPFGHGVNIWAYGIGDNQERVLKLAAEAGLNYVRQQLRWDYIEPAAGQYDWKELDGLVQAVQKNNLNLVLSVVKAPFWASSKPGGFPDNPADFERFMARLGERYKGQVVAYEIWNEPNIGLEVGGEVSVARFIATLKAGYRGVKQSDPAALVITGATSASGVNKLPEVMDDLDFVRACYAFNNGEWRNYFDALGLHPGGAANPPEELWPTNPPADRARGWTNHPSFYFRRFENHREVMQKYGDGDKQIWLTEFGWATENTTPGFEYGNFNSEQQQADYIVRAFQRGPSYGYLGPMLLWNLNFAALASLNPDAQERAWSIIRSDYSPRPAYQAIRQMNR